MTDNCFKTSFKLKSIVLKDNFLSRIDNKAFSNLRELLLLDLSNNCLQEFSSDGLVHSIKLHILKICDNSLASITKYSFNKIPLKILETDDYRICCIVKSGTKCTADIPWYISCSNLLPNMAVRVAFYCFSITIIIANIVSIILQTVSSKKGIDKTAAFGTTVASINIADISLSLIHI